MSIPLAAALLAAACAAPAQEPAAAPPRLAFAEWRNHAPVAPESLDGRIVALAFVRVEEPDSLHFLDVWEKLRHEFALEPVTFLAVTPEPAEVVAAAIDVEGIDVPLVRDPSDALARHVGVQVLPGIAVRGPRGAIAWVGEPSGLHAAKDVIREELRRARHFPPLPRQHAAIEKALDAGQLGKAHAAAVKARDRAKDDAERGQLADLATLLEELALRGRAAAEAAVVDEDWPRAGVLLARLADELAGVPGAEDAATRLTELEQDPARRDELLAAKELAKAGAQARKGDAKGARRTYEAVGKRFPATKAAKIAAGELARLGG